MTKREPSERGQSMRDTEFVKQKPAAEVDDELRFHLEERVAKNIASGMSPEAARRAALERFGDVGGVRDECEKILIEDRKAESRRDWLDDLRQDLRFALRSAVHAPLFSLLAVATLALGIGANAAVFGVVKSVLLDALPYSEPSRLMRLFTPLRSSNLMRGALSAGTISDVRERQHSFAALGAFQSIRDVTYSGTDAPQVMKAMFVEPALLQTLGVHPIRGAGFRDDDAAHDTTTVTMLSYGAWQRVFGGDANVIGKSIRINGLPRTIVGVMPRDFVPPAENEPDFYLPLGMSIFMRNPVSVRGSHNFGFIGRLKPGVSPEAAQRELSAMGDELEKLYLKDNVGIGLTAVPLRDSMVGDTRTPLLVLLASAALVLLITCANLAGALLSRTIARRKEFAVRVALGAGRGRLVRQLLTESVVLAFVGGVAGIALALLGLGALRGLSIAALPSYARLSLDSGAIVVTFALALITGLAFGVGPALSVGRSDPQRTLRDDTRGASESVRTRRMRGILVAGQIGLCVSLLAAAALVTRGLLAITSAPIGVNPDNLLTFTLQVPGAKYRTTISRVQLHDQIEQAIRTLPGVAGVASMTSLPTTVTNSNGIFIEGSPRSPNDAVPFVLTVIASDDYFHTLGVPLKQGRVFNASDRPDLPQTIIINDAFARQYFPKGNAVGSRIHIGPPGPDLLTIVGVVGNVRNDPTHLMPEPMMYLANRQAPGGDTYAVRAKGNPTALLPEVRRAIASVDPVIPIYRVSTLNDVIGDTFRARRLPVVLMTAFGSLALLLASVGVYAMFASMAAAREREFGVRVALGSSRGAIAGLVLRQGGVWMVIGLAIGAIGVGVASQLVKTQLFGVPEFDPIAIGAAVVALLVCATAALLVPVRRATRVDPITVLR
jgi:putative ABC transport system permease protein